MRRMNWFLMFFIGCLILIKCSMIQSGMSGNIKKAGKVGLPKVFGNHMVLQRNAPIPVWGFAEPGGEVLIRLGYQKQSTIADASGQWSLELPSMQAGGPYEMVVLGKNVIRFTDVYIGEVWICSGQSNMEWAVSQSNQAQEEIDNADYPMIRLLQVDHNVAFQPLDDINTNGWQRCSPSTVSNFSAVGYFFGRSLHEKLNVPIGLIHTSWGGTVAEAWTSKPALEAFPEFSDAIHQLEDSLQGQPSYEEQQGLYEVAQKNWMDSLDSLDQGQQTEGLGWADPGLFADDWSKAILPGLWENMEIGNYDGIVWYRKSFLVPDSLDSEKWKISLGLIDDIDQTWVNGVYVGTMDVYNELREYDVPENIIQPGMNVVVVRVVDHHGGGGIWGSEDQMTLIGESDVRLPLAGEWLYKIGVPQDLMPPVPQAMVGLENYPTTLFNAMIHPIVPFGMRGAIWYQGEANADRAYQYRSLFPVMISDWRSQWKQEFPFLFVQLANYMAVRSGPSNSQWAELREAQSMTLALANTGMAVIIDIGEADDIHPKNKQDVGKRLALNALAKVYDQDVVYSGPMYQSMRIEGQKIILSFDHVDGGLLAKGDGVLKGFAIAGADQKFVWADAMIDGESVIVSSALIKDPVAVRYAWADNPICNLYNKAGLPACPFRTDDWSGLSWPK